MEFNSLLWLKDSKKQKINPSVIKDLGLDTIYEKLIGISEHNETIIYELCMDPDTLIYRQGLLSNFMDTPNLLSDLVMNLEGFLELKPRLSGDYKSPTHFYTLINLVIVVEASIKCLEDLNQTLLYHKLTATGLLQLKEGVSDMLVQPSFKKMKKDLKDIRHILSEINSVEVSINMDPGMRPTDAQVTEVNENSYHFPKAFRKVADALGMDREFQGKYMKSYVPVFGLGRLDWDLLDELEHAFKQHRTALKQFLTAYQTIEIKPFLNLLRELTFYQASYAMLIQLKEFQLPLSVPDLLEPDQRIMELEGLYNVNTAFDKQGQGLVLNDLTMNEAGRIFILTGANMGGKTTVTQAVGQIQVFAQLGLLVPANKARLSLVDHIFTHFPVLEKDTVNLGRLGKECQMFSEVYKQTTPQSLLLLNEPFTGTSYLESLKIAEEAVRAVKYRRTRMIINTHLHELPKSTRDYNVEMENDTNIISLVVGKESCHTSFRVEIGEPLGQSYAQDIALKHGVTFEQLTKRLGGFPI